MNRNAISAIIIAKDEEKNIDRCISSLKECTSEIIVIIDSCTKDKTEAIVKRHGVYYEIRDWEGYVKTKVYAISKTSYNWILWIDADEVVTVELAEEINKLNLSASEVIAYSVPRKAFFLGKWIKHSGWYPGRVIRLFNKKNINFAENTVHEHLLIGSSAVKLKNDLEHWTDPSIEHYFHKFNNYTSLAAEELYARQKKANILDIILRPAFIFNKMFFFRLGFLDGMHGFIIAIFSSAYVFTKYCKLWELQNNKIDKNGNRNYSKS